jgi:hypothetical protein
MKTVDAPTFSERVDRFVRWFFTVSPEAVIEPWQPTPAKPRSGTVAHRKPARLRPRHSGPVRVAVKGKP